MTLSWDSFAYSNCQRWYYSHQMPNVAQFFPEITFKAEYDFIPVIQYDHVFTFHHFWNYIMNFFISKSCLMPLLTVTPLAFQNDIYFWERKMIWLLAWKEFQWYIGTSFIDNKPDTASTALHSKDHVGIRTCEDRFRLPPELRASWTSCNSNGVFSYLIWIIEAARPRIVVHFVIFIVVVVVSQQGVKRFPAVFHLVKRTEQIACVHNAPHVYLRL